MWCSVSQTFHGIVVGLGDTFSFVSLADLDCCRVRKSPFVLPCVSVKLNLYVIEFVQLLSLYALVESFRCARHICGSKFKVQTTRHLVVANLIFGLVVESC